MQNSRKCLALFSGGLDSLLAVFWMRDLGYDVVPITFSAPYIPAERAQLSARENGLELKVVDIAKAHLDTLMQPVHGYGKNFNPCIDCHALMFREAGKLMAEMGASFLITGEVLGQRPMSQTRNSLQAVNKLSGVGDLLVRPLSQKLLPDTRPIRESWVSKAEMLDFQGRGRGRQIELAKHFKLSYPSPGGGCLLTDRNYSRRLQDLVDHDQFNAEQIKLLRWGRHFRLSPSLKLIVGRSETDNQGLEDISFPGIYFQAKDVMGPLALLTSYDADNSTIERSASILLAFCPKANSPDFVNYGVDRKLDREIKVFKCPETVYRPLLISLDKER